MNKNLKSAITLQKEIFLGGLRGDKPAIPINEIELRESARSKISKKAFDYLDGGAGFEATMITNRKAFHDIKIIPQMLKDVSVRDLSIEFLGHKYSSPFFLCPIGVLELAHPEADLAVAEACHLTDLPLMISSQASTPMEAIAARMPDTFKFFQLYWSKSEALVESFVSRAEASACMAIVVTLDTTLLGWRVRDLQHAYLPFLYGMGLAQYISDPVFNKLLKESNPDSSPKPKANLQLIKSLWEMAKRHPGSTFSNFRTRAPLAAIRKFIDIYMNPSLQWSDLIRLRKMTKLPVILKGIQHPEDALKAVNAGVDGIVVSNHGGRQIDGAVSSLQSLRMCKDVIGDQIAILFDSGIRSGADAFKAMALGADMVGIGRPYAYALAAGGMSGVKAVIEHIRAEFELTMALAGCREISEINRNYLHL